MALVPGAPLRATSAVTVTADLAALVVAAGGTMENARYDAAAGMLTVNGVSQDALDAAIAAGIDPLHAERQAVGIAADRQIAARVAEGMPWSGKVLQIHQEALNDLTSSVLAAQVGALPPGFAWRMADNTFLPLDAAGMTAMGAAAMGYFYSLLQRYWQIKGEAEAAPDQVALLAIDATSGWPEPPAS